MLATSGVWASESAAPVRLQVVPASSGAPADQVGNQSDLGRPDSAVEADHRSTQVEDVPADRDRVSVLVWLQPAKQGEEAQAEVARTGVREFATAVQGFVHYEYAVLPNVLNLRDIPAAALKDLESLPGVERVELDTYDIRINLHDSTPLVRGLQSQITGAGLSADGAGVRICIVDTGIDTDHIMYSSRIDLAASYDFYNDDTNPEDDNGHGSHVAGIAAGGTGLVVDFGCVGPEPFQGIAPAATLISAKVLNSFGGGYDSDIIAGIDHCANQAPSGGRADVINLSIGTGQYSGPCTHSWAVASNNAVNNGVVVVAASGNNNYTNAMTSPACGEKVISAGATYDENFPNCENATSTFNWSNCTDVQPRVDQVVCFSNESDYLDVTAPGAVIYSASTAAGGSSITAKSGTSMASPHVAGLAALILDVDPALTPAEVRQFIRSGAIDKGPAGRDRAYGYGRIDVINTLQLLGPQCQYNSDCDDGLYCNGAETCVSGSCQAGTAPNCSDGVACTTDSCNETTDSCDHAPNNAACSDGLYCNGVETCHVTLGCQAGTAVDCNDGIACTNDSCNETTDSCDRVPNNAACDDGLFCNGAETCVVGIGCQAGTAPNCGDGIACTADSCNETTDTCDHVPNDAACDDGLFCTGTEICNVSSGCQSSGTPCPGQLCDEGTDTCYDCQTPADCDDGAYCNGAEQCVGGTCQAGTAVDCNDGIACTNDSCNESTDSCDHAPNNAACDDGLFCNGTETCNVSTGCVAGSDPCPGLTCDEINDVCVGGAAVWMTFKTTTTVPGVGSAENEDIVAYDVNAGTWSLIFDGSDVGLSSFEIDGMAVLASGNILLSFTVAGNVTGLQGGPSGTSVDDSDIIRFVPTSLGATTAGSFYFYFDGSDVGLTLDAEDIDAIALTSDGKLIISSTGNFSGTGASGLDEDLFQFNATSLGAATAGSFQMYFDGSDVGLADTSNEDVDGAGLTPDGKLLLSTEGNFSVPGVSGGDEDVIRFTPTSLGSNTAGTYTMYLDLSALGISTGADAGEVEWVE